MGPEQRTAHLFGESARATRILCSRSSERAKPQNEVKEAPRSPESTADRAREAVIVFESARPSETADRQKQLPNVDPSGNHPRPNPLLQYWGAFKAGLENDAVRIGYLASAAGFLAWGGTVETWGARGLMLAGPVALLGCTLFNHYRAARSFLEEELTD